MIKNHEAIYALYPSVVKVIHDIAYDIKDNVVDIDLDQVNAWIDPNAHKVKRADAYPPIGDQLDALWKGGTALEEMKAMVMAVKDKYPKP